MDIAQKGALTKGGGCFAAGSDDGSEIRLCWCFNQRSEGLDLLIALGKLRFDDHAGDRNIGDAIATKAAKL